MGPGERKIGKGRVRPDSGRQPFGDMNCRLKPVLDGDWRTVAPSPDLTAKLGRAGFLEEQATRVEHNAVVDNHVFCDALGIWHCWACVRCTAVGRVLYHWKTEDFFASPWQATGEVLRCDRTAGESIHDYHGQEWIQSPYFIEVDGTYFMFYGGHTTGVGADGNPAHGDDERNECQMCLMTSPDGVTWTRHRNAAGLSRIFVGPGEVRDPCLLNVDGVWHCYYAGYEAGKRHLPGFYVRTSDDLTNWSESICVHRDLDMAGGRWDCECPHVVYRQGYFYLFRTEDYYESRTHVYRSEDPLDFGVGEAGDKYVDLFPVAAPELFMGPDGQEFVTSVHNPPLGAQIAPVRWETRPTA